MPRGRTTASWSAMRPPPRVCARSCAPLAARPRSSTAAPGTSASPAQAEPGGQPGRLVKVSRDDVYAGLVGPAGDELRGGAVGDLPGAVAVSEGDRDGGRPPPAACVKAVSVLAQDPSPVGRDHQLAPVVGNVEGLIGEEVGPGAIDR